MTPCPGAISGRNIKKEKETCPRCGQELKVQTGIGFGAETKKICPNPGCNPFKRLSGKNGFGNF